RQPQVGRHVHHAGEDVPRRRRPERRAREPRPARRGDGARAPRPDGGMTMQDRPTALELLAAVRSFLEDDVVPVLEGRRRFHALVAVNVLAIVRREWEGEEETLVGEWKELAALLGHEPSGPPERLDALRRG